MANDYYKAAEAAATLIGTLEGWRNSERNRGNIKEALRINTILLDCLCQHSWSDVSTKWYYEIQNLQDELKTEIARTQAAS